MLSIAPLVALVALLTLGAPTEKTKLRVGHFPNLTHAQGVIGHGLSRAGTGWFEERLGPGVEIEWFVYNAGPSAMEALLAGSIDLAYVGPNPALNAYIRCEGDEVRIVAGAASGGAALVVQPDGRIRSDADFRGKRIGTPQLGNTQDVAARAFLGSRGLSVKLTGGDVLVIPTANPDQLTLFQKGDLDAVWTVEPWVSRLELEAGAKVWLEERTLWPETDGRYVTTHLVSSAALLANHRKLLERFLRGHVELTDWIVANPEEAQQLLNAELEAETRKGIPTALLERAWSRIELTHDPVSVSLRRSAHDAHAAGFLEKVPDLGRIYALEPLNAVLAASGRESIQ